jgi:cell surface protein SprA
MLLELIKAKYSRPHGNFGPVWNFMMRNFYNLGLTPTFPASLELSIHDNTPRLDPSTPTGSTIPYIQIFGLDQINAAGDRIPDGRVDLSVIDLNLTGGILQFPALWAFAPPPDSVHRWTAGEFSFYPDTLHALQYETSRRLYTEYLFNPFVSAYQYDIVVKVKRFE